MFHGQDTHATSTILPESLDIAPSSFVSSRASLFPITPQGLAKTVDIPIEQLVIEKAKSLIEALGYIQRFNERIVVVKLGGSFMNSEDEFKKVLTDVVFMQAVGMRPIIVHGGGKAITDAMKKAGLQAQFVQGRRYTDPRTLAIVEHVLCEINSFIVNTINELGGKAMPLTSLTSTCLFAEKMYLPGENGAKIDIGQVGQVTRVNAPLLQALTEADFIPVIAPIARDAAGEKLNVNADTAAGHVAAETKAEKLVLVSDTHGIRAKKDDPASLLRSITKSGIQKLIAEKEISEGMLPKVESCLIALDAGVKKAHIIDGRFPHSVLLEIYSDQGVGTEILRG
jgi:acetylglutamate kinase